MNRRELVDLAGQLVRDEPGAVADFQALTPANREAIIDHLLGDARGRRWLREYEGMTGELAARLTEYEVDFRTRRYDASLGKAVALAPPDTVQRHATAIAAGSGAPALWERLAGHPDELAETARRIIASGDPEAVEITLTYLLLDPLDPYGLGAEHRVAIASAALDTPDSAARGFASEYLAGAVPRVLAERIEALMLDESARVRGYGWLAAFRVEPDDAAERAMGLLADESVAVDIRKSALSATGEALPTAQVVELLAYFVAHPSAELATEAANLLFRHHRHPQIALAAAESPHAEVREIAARLLDPYRGSPAAGGSRRGDPLRSDPLIEMLRQLEEEQEKSRE
jgi:hypothetical protein